MHSFRVRLSAGRFPRVVAGAVLIASAALNPAAHAANSEATASVTAVPAQISLSRGEQPTFLSGLVNITSTSGNVINQVRITITSRVFSSTGEITSDVVYKEAIAASSNATDSPACSVDTSYAPLGTKVVCVVGQLRSLSEAPFNSSNFNVVFTGTSSESAASVQLHWFADFSSGNSSSSPPSDGLIAEGDTAYPVITATLDQQRLGFKTFVPTVSQGQYETYQTGNGAALKEDNFAVKISVPKSGKAEVTESDSGCAGLAVNGVAYACLGKQGQFVIPGAFNADGVAKLVYDLQFDASLIKARKPGAKAKDIVLFYASDDAPDVFNAIPLCTDTPTDGPTPNNPCIRVREDLKKTSTAPDAGGDVHLQLELSNNGFIRG